jgi:hypothetical protein
MALGLKFPNNAPGIVLFVIEDQAKELNICVKASAVIGRLTRLRQLYFNE